MVYPIKSTIIRSLRIYANKYPDKKAVICGDDSITFSQLFSQAMELGSEFSRDVEKRVYILNERNIQTIVKMFATLAAGKRYRVINDFSEVDDEENEALDRQLEDSDFSEYNIMYEIKTSGTTGVKKLIPRYQEFFREFMDGYKVTYEISHRDVILNQLEFTFDAASKDIYAMALTGATLCIGNRSEMNFPMSFMNTIEKYNVTVFQTTPFFIKNMTKLRAFDEKAPVGLRVVLFVGGIMKAEYINYWIEKMPATLFVNQYGASEMEGNLMYHKIKGRVESEYVPLTKWVSPMMIGENGELCTYYHSDVPTGLGDVVRYMQKDEPGYVSKALLVTGRIDNIRKIRGYRMGLEEIDRALSGLLHIKETLCEIVDDEVYALCETDGERLDEKLLRGQLKKVLPAYCQPVHIRQVEVLPVNNNGKYDRKKIMEYFEN